MVNLLLVGIGGFLGSVLRYSLALFFSGTSGPLLPWPTVIVNLLGSFSIGALLAFGQAKTGESWYLFLVPGLLGGFTTYSAYSGEALLLIKEQLYAPAAAYIALTFIGSLLLAALGFSLAKMTV